MAKEPKANAADAAEAAPATPRSRKKLIILVAGTILLAGAGAAGWMMLGGDPAHGEAQAKAEGKRSAIASGPPVFLPLEPFIVNLQPPGGGQFLQVDVTLRVADQHVVTEVKTLMPEVRDRVLRLLATRNAQELTAPGGREKLAEAVRMEITRVIDPDAARETEAPKITREPAPGMDGAPAEPSADVEPEEPSVDEAADDEASAAEDLKVRSVLFTSFIIQ